MPLASGEQLGHYKIQSLIGNGGMGEVYRALDTKLEREVKFSRAEFIRRETARGESMALIKETQELADV